MMKQLNLTILLIFLMSMVGIKTFAHDFAVANEDGVTIYYAKTSGTEVAVSYCGSSVNSVSNEYTGNVVIPESVTYDGTTYSVTSIGKGAFYLCSSLSFVRIPISVTSIENQAFYLCSSLVSVKIPISVTNIGISAFRSCSGLTSIKVEAGNTKYDSRDNCNAIIETESNTLIKGCQTTTIPSSVTKIGEEAFWYCTGLTSISIPCSVTSIGEDAFYQCSDLTSVCVWDLESWCKISFGNTFSNPLNEARHLFLNGVEVKDLVVPNSVASIKDYAFYRCSSLNSVTIPNSVTYIGKESFEQCNELISVTAENNTPITIYSNTFSNRNNVALYVPAGAKSAYESTDYWKEFKEIIEMEPVVNLGDANGDDEVDAEDIVTITEYMMGKEPENFNIRNADVNGDGVINIADIIQITNQILSKE